MRILFPSAILSSNADGSGQKMGIAEAEGFKFKRRLRLDRSSRLRRQIASRSSGVLSPSSCSTGGSKTGKSGGTSRGGASPRGSDSLPCALVVLASDDSG